MNCEDGYQRTMIKGIVIPVEWDDTGKVRTIEVLTADEGEFQVAPGGAGEQLMMHLRSEILAEAVLLDQVGPIRRVRVDSFAVLDWTDPGD